MFSAKKQQTVDDFNDPENKDQNSINVSVSFDFYSKLLKSDTVYIFFSVSIETNLPQIRQNLMLFCGYILVFVWKKIVKSSFLIHKHF